MTASPSRNQSHSFYIDALLAHRNHSPLDAASANAIAGAENSIFFSTGFLRPSVPARMATGISGDQEVG